MKITGYKIREALTQQELVKDAAQKQFDDSLKKFPGEEKLSPSQIVATIWEAETAIVRLQHLQCEYNLKVQVSVLGKTFSLAAAIKTLGAASRIEKLWRTASTSTRAPRNAYSNDSPDERDPNKLIAQPTISIADATEKAKAAMKLTAAFREAVGVGNGQEVEFSLTEPLTALLGDGA